MPPRSDPSPAQASASSGGPDDSALMLRFAAGDLRAFETLYARHERPVYRYLLRSVGNPALADELLQEVWLTVVRQAGRYEARALFTTWLYRLARSRLVDHWRARDGVDMASLADPVDGAEDLTLGEVLGAPPAQQPEVLALGRAQARDFARAIEALPVAQREAFLLHVEADLTLEQIADITGTGRETVKSRFRYACAKLREQLKAWE